LTSDTEINENGDQDEDEATDENEYGTWLPSTFLIDGPEVVCECSSQCFLQVRLRIFAIYGPKGLLHLDYAYIAMGSHDQSTASAVTG
jgi:hypothetical protein